MSFYKIESKFFVIFFAICLFITNNQITYAQDTIKTKSIKGEVLKEYDPNTGLVTQYSQQENSATNFACSDDDSNEIIVKFKALAIPKLKSKTLLASSSSLTEKEVANFFQSKNKKYHTKKVKKLFSDRSIKPLALSLKHKQRQTSRLNKLKYLRTKYQLENIFIVNLNSQNCLEQKRILQDLNHDLSIEYAEPNLEIKTNTTKDYFSNTNGKAWTLGYSESWGFEQIEAEKAWEESQGKGVVVAIIDTGVDYNHPDLWDNIWVNPLVATDLNKDGKVNLDDVDLNHNKFIDANEILTDIFGKDFVNNDSAPIDDSGHGTHVAGTIAAVANNSIGIAGVAPEAQILPIKVLSAAGSGSLSSIAQGLQYTIDLFLTNADIESMVTNNSYGGSGTSELLEDMFNQAKEAGIISVAAAGNSNTNAIDTIPARYDSVITVGSVGYNKLKSGFSSYGSVVDIAAPGGGDSNDTNAANILSAISLNSRLMQTRPQYKITDSDSSPYFYARLAGTSMATPHVVGVAALIKAKHPEWNPDEVQDTLVNTSQEFLQNKQERIGSGIVNASTALSINSSYPFAKIIDLPNTIAGITPINFIASKSPNGLDVAKVELAWSQDLIEWQAIPIADSESVASFNTSVATNSDIFFRLKVIDKAGRTNTSIQSTRVENFKLTHPLSGDITNAHDPLPIRASFYSTQITNFQVLYKMGADPNWHEEAMTLDLSKPGKEFIDEEIASLDVTKLKADEVYSIKLVIEYGKDGSTETEPISFYIDSKLKKGFPIYFGNKLDVLLFNQTEAPIVTNINDDKEKELLAIAPSYDADLGLLTFTLKAWEHSGKELWSQNILYPGNLLGIDVDNDTKSEIFFNTSEDTSLLIHSLDGNGKERANFPITIKNHYLSTIKVADIDNDQELEIISMISSRISNEKSLLIINAKTGIVEQNTTIKVLPAEDSFTLANLDKEPDLEILYHTGEFSYTQLSAINFDASPVDGWPARTDENIITIENIEAADLDNDGIDEVVAKVASIVSRTAESMTYYPRAAIFNHDGILVKVIENAPESTFSFTDIDSNKEKDILFTNNYGFDIGRIFAVNKAGENLANWPLEVLDTTLRRTNFENIIETILVSDINNDKEDDLLFSFAGLGRSFYNNSTLEDSAGIFAFNKDQNSLDLNPRDDSKVLVLGTTGNLKPSGSKSESSAGFPQITDIEEDGFKDLVISKSYEYGFENSTKLNGYDPFIKMGTLIYAWDFAGIAKSAEETHTPEPSPSPNPIPTPIPDPIPNPIPDPAPNPTFPSNPVPPVDPDPTPAPEPDPDPDPVKPINPLEEIEASFQFNRLLIDDPIAEIKSLKKNNFNLVKFSIVKTAISEAKPLRFSLTTTDEFASLISFGSNDLQTIPAIKDSKYIQVKIPKRNKFLKQYPGITMIDIPITVTDIDSGYLDSGFIRVYFN